MGHGTWPTWPRPDRHRSPRRARAGPWYAEGGRPAQAPPVNGLAHSGMTTVLMILSANVWRLASQSGNSQPM